MDAFDQPAPALWRDRAVWFQDAIEAARGDTHGAVGDQAMALLVELETVFCAGAWVASVVLAGAIVEAQVREQGARRGGGGNRRFLDTATLFDEAGLGEEYDWLRRERNRLLHFAEEPYITVEMHWFRKDEFEENARRAVTLAVTAVFAG